MADIRIGHGYDVHRLVSQRKLILGGVEISHPLGLLGHSDADVVTHAFMDALLGAIALGDIGKHFPDSSAEFKDISSMLLLEKVCSLVNEKGYRISNADITIIAQKPKLSPYIEKMKDNICKICKCNADAVNIKATTEENLGFTGREEGISAHAVVILERRKV